MKVRPFALVAVGILAVTPDGGVTQEQVTYLEAQAANGGAAYNRNCAECHQEDMGGSFEAPELAGPNFRNFWSGRPVNELIEMVAFMPPDEEGTLGEGVYTNIAAYILSRNGIPSSDQALAYNSTGLMDGATGVPVDILSLIHI